MSEPGYSIRVWVGPTDVQLIASHLRAWGVVVAEGTEHVYIPLLTFDAVRSVFKSARLHMPDYMHMSSCRWVWDAHGNEIGRKC